MNDPQGQPLTVMIVTPLGEGGKGGIDRIMDGVRRDLEARPRADMSARFVVTRGQGSILMAPALTLQTIAGLFGAKMTARRPVAHINLSSHGSTIRKLFVAAAARAAGVPYVIHLHGSRFRQYWDGLPTWLSNQVKAMFENAAAVAVLGGVWRDYVQAKAPRSHVVILPNATPAAPQAIVGESDRTRILFLGRVGERKGVPELLDALAILKDDPRWSAVIAGDGDVAGFEAKSKALGLDAAVRFTGWVGPQQVDELLKSSDVLVLPSHDENLPMSVIEAMSHGLAVVTTPVGAVEDIIKDGETGLLVPVGDADRLAQALRSLVESPARIKALGHAARAFHAENLEIKPYVDRLVAIWKSAAVRAKA